MSDVDCVDLTVKVAMTLTRANVVLSRPKEIGVTAPVQGLRSAKRSIGYMAAK